VTCISPHQRHGSVTGRVMGMWVRPGAAVGRSSIPSDQVTGDPGAVRVVALTRIDTREVQRGLLHLPI